FLFRNTLAAKGVKDLFTDSRNARRVFVSEGSQPIQSAGKPSGAQHPQANGRVRLQILDVKYKWRTFERRDDPCGDAEKQRRWSNYVNVRAFQRKHPQGRGEDKG